MGFEYRLLPDHSWADSEIAGIALCHLTPDSGLRHLLLYFQDRSQLSQDEYNEIAMRVDSEVSERLAGYSKATADVLRGLLSRVRHLLTSMNRVWQDLDDPTEPMMALMNTELIAMSHRSPQKERRIRVHPSLYIAFAPIKRKCSNSKIRVKQKVQVGSSLFECSAKRIKFFGEQEIHFALTKDLAVINKTPIRLDSIKYVLARTVNDAETAVEILFRSGKLILIDFAPLDNSRVLREFARVGLKATHLISKIFSEEAFSEAWSHGYCSNFYYMMQINFFSGRTVNYSQLMPWLPTVTEDPTEGDIWPVTIDPFLMEGDLESAYIYRRLLETDWITQKLPEFIDRFFGYAMSGDSGHRQLFECPHPHRTVCLCDWKPDQLRQIIWGTSVAFCSLLWRRADSFLFNLISSGGESIQVSVEVGQRVMISEAILCKFPCPKQAIVSSFKQNVIVYNRGDMSLHRLYKGDRVGTTSLYSETDLIACSNRGSVVFCPTSTCVAKRSIDNEMETLCYTFSPIRFLSVNPRFKMFAVGTLDGTISVHSLTTGRSVMQTRLNHDILMMTVTPRMCFVVGFTSFDVSILTLNGELIKTVPFERKILHVFTVSSANDFDYIVVQAENFEVGFFEVFFPENFVVFTTVNEEVVAVVYSEAILSFLMVSRSGSLMTIPQSLKINPD
jgi:hypothetical protein